MISGYQDLATPRIKAILEQLAPAQRKMMLARLGKELEREIKAHFVKRDDEGNQSGFPRTHFWTREGRNNTALRDVTADTATVGIASPQIAHKLTGGTIRPGPGRRFLALPLREEAAGVLPRAGTIPGLFVMRSKILGTAWLATNEGGALRFYWRLTPSVDQAADPRTLPPIDALRAKLEARAETELSRIVGQT